MVVLTGKLGGGKLSENAPFPNLLLLDAEEQLFLSVKECG